MIFNDYLFIYDQQNGCSSHNTFPNLKFGERAMILDLFFEFARFLHKSKNNEFSYSNMCNNITRKYKFILSRQETLFIRKRIAHLLFEI